MALTQVSVLSKEEVDKGTLGRRSFCRIGSKAMGKQLLWKVSPAVCFRSQAGSLGNVAEQSEIHWNYNQIKRDWPMEGQLTGSEEVSYFQKV